MGQKSKINLTKKENEILKILRKAKKNKIYLGYTVPYNHPDNDLTKKQNKIFSSERRTLNSLVKKKVLEVIFEDRRSISYDEIIPIGDSV